MLSMQAQPNFLVHQNDTPRHFTQTSNAPFKEIFVSPPTWAQVQFSLFLFLLFPLFSTVQLTSLFASLCFSIPSPCIYQGKQTSTTASVCTTAHRTCRFHVAKLKQILLVVKLNLSYMYFYQLHHSHLISELIFPV